LRALGNVEALTDDSYQRDDPMLIRYIQQHILPRRGIVAEPENILLTLGAQNALWIVANLLLTQRRTAAMENPGYPSLREILRQTRCRTMEIDVDADGLPPEALPEDVDVLFVTASHHCPTNVTMPIERRRRLLELSQQRGFVIVEDDYEFQISFDTPTAPALKALDDGGTVIHVGSFSKALFPGLRLGFIVAPEDVIEEGRSLRSLVLRHPPGLVQRTTANFLSFGYFDALVNRMRKSFEKRHSVVEEALREHGLEIVNAPIRGGSSFWMRAQGIDTNALAARLYNHGVLIEPGIAFFCQERRKLDHYRIAYSSIPPARISDGIAIIAREIRNSCTMQ
jgi:GntR family transcriptional regulator/MocR family aminotransferase